MLAKQQMNKKEQYDPTQDLVLTPHDSLKQKQLETDFEDRVADHDAYGLEYLTNLSILYIQKKFDPGEVNMGYEMNNKYEILSTNNRRVFLASEDTDRCDRYCLGKNRPFNVHLYNNYGQAVVLITRKCNCSLCWWGGRIAGSNVTVTLETSGEMLGSVVQDCSPCTPHYKILDASGQVVLRIRGPCCSSSSPCCMCCEPSFTIYSESTGKKIGIMQKTFRFEENVSDSISFAVKFDADLSPAVKVVVIGAIFCIDFSFFEKGANCSGYPACVWCLYVLLVAIIISIIVTLVLVYN